MIYPECGTYAGSLRHQREGTPRCALCRQAAARYMRQWRAAGKCVRGLGWPAAASGGRR